MTKSKKSNEINFRLRGRFFHLTYKEWHCVDCIKALLNHSLKRREYFIKVAHETNDKEHDYYHTHVLLFVVKSIDKKNPRCFDIDDVHPHIKKVNTSEYYSNVYKYLDKENCVLDELNGEEYPTDGMSDLKRIIQSYDCWADVINDESIAKQLQRVLQWAKEIFAHRPRKNYSKEIILRPWQLKVVDLLLEQDNRKVLWIYDQIGGNGKSVLTNWLIDGTVGAFFCNGGKIGDIAYAYQNEPVVVFDLPRSSEEFTPYRAMECLKDGRFFSPKYQSCRKRFKPAKVVVFANFRPVRSKMSDNRWVIYDLTDCELEDES